MKTILHSLHIDASAKDVYRALTTEAGVKGWWTTKATVEEGEGGEIRFTFHGDFHPRVKQVRLVEAERVEWKCVGGHPNWEEDRFTFEIRGEEEGCSLRFTQEYARELDDDVYGNYNFNWGYYLNSLKRHCEAEEGTPFRVPDASD